MVRRLLAIAIFALIVVPAPATDPPHVVRENIEWLDVWVPGNEVKGRPRILLIGDSITRGYYGEVEKRLQDKAIVARLTTSKSVGDPGLLAEVSLVLAQTKFDIVHFNNGLHGWGYTDEEYARALPDLLAAIRKGGTGGEAGLGQHHAGPRGRQARPAVAQERTGKGPKQGRGGPDGT